MTSSRFCQSPQIVDGFVRHRVRFQIIPDVLDRIKLRGIGREELESPSSFDGDKRLDNQRPMRQETIPYHNDRVSKMTAQVLKE